MSLDSPNRFLRSNVLAYPTRGRAADLDSFVPPTPMPVLGGGTPPSTCKEQKHRTKIWDLAPSLHCSIIGTCLSTAELRQILVRLDVSDALRANDHELHGLGVMLAGRRDLGAKFLQKALDRRHETAIKKFTAASDVAAVGALWKDALQSGEIAGGYWATLTHPLTDEVLIKQAFGDVHMLSHLVGAANRADIRRLRQLEAENARLAEKLSRAQLQIREGFRERDHAIRQLNALVARRDMPPLTRPESGDRVADDQEAADAIKDLSRKLAHEDARRERAERQAATLAEALRERERALDAVAIERDTLRRELELVEQTLTSSFVSPAASGGGVNAQLAGLSVLYVGGRATTLPQLKAVVEASLGQFLHHDGGIEHSLNQLPGLISRSSVVLFPVDCVSHSAVSIVKRNCQQANKRYVPLRSASLTCFVSAMPNLRAAADGE